MGDEQRLSPDEQLAYAREQFDGGRDLTLAVEEEFALLDPETLDLVNRFEELQTAARGTPLAESLAGELVSCEAEDDLVGAGVKILFNYSEALLDVPGDVQVHTSNPAGELLPPLYFPLPQTPLQGPRRWCKPRGRGSLEEVHRMRRCGRRDGRRRARGARLH